MERTTRYFSLATRLLAETGAHIIKTYYCDNFEQVTAACPVPIVIAGGKKIPERDALEMAYRAVNEGAAGVDMGRNVCRLPHRRQCCVQSAWLYMKTLLRKQLTMLMSYGRRMWIK